MFDNSNMSCPRVELGAARLKSQQKLFFINI